MSEAHQIRKNSFFSLISTSSRLIANSILLIIINNVYGKEIAGQFVTANVISGLFIAFADFGIDLLLTTEVAKDRENANNIFSGLLSIKVILIILSFLILCLLAYVINFSQPTKMLLYIFSLYTAIMIINNYFSAFFRGIEKFFVDAKVSMISNLCLIVFVILFSMTGFSIYYIAFSYVLSRLLGSLSYVIMVKKMFPGFSFRLCFNYIKGIKNKVFVFGTNLVFTNIYGQMDTLFLQFWIGDSAVGIYQAAARIFSMPLVLADVLTNSFIPTLSRYYKENKIQWNKLGFVLNKTLIFLSIPFAIFLFVYPEQIIGLVYFNKDFSQSTEILRLFSLLLIVRFATDPSGIMITTSNKQHIRMRLIIVFTFISIPIYLFCISKYGIVGAIRTQLFTNGFLGFAYILVVFSEVKKWFFVKEIIITLLMSSILFVLIWEFKTISFWFTIPPMFIFYMFFIIRFGYKTEEKDFLIPSLNNIFSFLHRFRKNTS
jgi:O-antigen/teichoic acid export membrane protein